VKRIIIAIDGYSSTGKSTIAKQLAKALGYVYVDTGAMYRAVTLFALRKHLVSAKHLDKEILIDLLDDIELSFKYNDELEFSEMFLNGENVEQEIRQMKVSQYVSPIAEIKEVRAELVMIQQEMGKEKGLVMDGRDIGTVVFPQAELKIFMTASPEKRAYRRYKELLDRGEDVAFEEVLENVQKRDHIDSTREFSPLKQAKDAIVFDNTDMGLEEQFERLLNFANRIIEK